MLPSKLMSPTFVVIGAIVGGVALSLNRCHAAVIDLFDDQPQATLQLSNFHETESHGLFDRRTMVLTSGSNSRIEPNRDSLTISGGALNYLNPEPQPLGPRTTGYFKVTYSADEPVNLLADGATHLRLQFDSRTARFIGAIELQNGDERGRSVSLSRFDRNLEVIDIPFSLFSSFDPTETTSLTLDGYRIQQGSSFRLTSITTVPEPSFPILSALSLTMLSVIRRRHPSQNPPAQT